MRAFSALLLAALSLLNVTSALVVPAASLRRPMGRIVQRRAPILLQESDPETGDASALGEPPMEEVPPVAPELEIKLSPVAKLRQKQANSDESEWLASRSSDMVMQQNIARGIFAVLALGVGFLLSQSIGNVNVASSTAPKPAGSSFELPFKLPPGPTIRTGYEGRTDIGTYRPLFPPAEGK
mmetsp:Transcript_23224/g.59224  ORF Transcript_23224/g.59224 Transcript_23224/m.59224 type:complete len:182 (+) Transcript_23224:46-591(+)|eukprot:CAMPEP_0115858354 /NCGR_PEP_ID=MMETSP0287-20121206/16053_1 /TAXON_ID=412157 /ORGANISM="Chrysochromulina rotalis, Strain UIO044" /LENGTH=181 /DNA_ID=CAMNT_0003312613 /DNA_START=20 /DNA_END=565 /DNA_ORIENTATION=+